MELERISPEKAGISSKQVKKCIQALMHDQTEMHGFMAARHGKVFAQCHWKPYNKDLPHSNHSLGKSYTATGIGLAYTQGMLSLDEKIVDIFADEIKRAEIVPNEYLSHLTIKDVLKMANGQGRHPGMSDDWIGDYLKEPFIEEPGTRFMYNTSGTCILSAIVQRKTGITLFDYLKRDLFPYIGINGDDFRWFRFKDGTSAAPGTFSKAEDNLRLAQLYLNHGEFDGKQIIARDYIDAAVSVQIRTDNNKGGIIDCQKGYGYQLWACSFPGVFRFDGGQGQYALMWPEKDIVVIVHEGAMAPEGTQITLDVLYDELLKHISDIPLEENEEAYKDLLCYEDNLKIPAEEPNRIKVAPDKFSGSYVVTSGDKEAHPWIILAPGPVNHYVLFYEKDKKVDMTDFTLSIDDEKCEFTVDGYAKFVAFFDGRFEPIYTDNVFPQIGLNCSTAKYIDENTLEIKIRWMYSWFINIITFEKIGDTLKITIAKDRMQNDSKRWYKYYAEAKKLEGDK